jgi:thioredoxin 1
MSMTYVTLSNANFEEEVSKSDGVVLVDFWATWCPPCRALGPIIEELSMEYKGKAKVAKLDVDQNQEIASSFGVMSLPTVILFKGGKPIKSLVGVQPKDSYKQELDQLL